MWKTLEETEKSLNEKINMKDYDVSGFFLEENHPPRSPHEAAKRRGDRIELEGFYLDVSIFVLCFSHLDIVSTVKKDNLF